MLNGCHKAQDSTGPLAGMAGNSGWQAVAVDSNNWPPAQGLERSRLPGAVAPDSSGQAVSEQALCSN